MNFYRQLRRELLINARQPRVIINATLFFIMVSVFFPLALPADSQMLRQFAPGLIWIAVLFAMMLASERILQQDFDDGVLEQWAISGYPLQRLIVAKIMVHWLLIILPILLFCPILAILFDFNTNTLLVLILSLVCGTPAILGLCTLAASFGLGLQQKGILMALILLPLTIPVMIFGSGMVTMAMDEALISAYLAILLALSLLAFAFLPYAIAAIIRISLAD